MDMLFELIILVLGLVLLYYKLGRRPHGLPPGDWGYPILGVLPKGREEFSRMIQTHYKKYGNIFSMKMGSHVYVFLADFQMIKKAFLKKELSGRPKTYSLSILRFASEYGIVWSEGHVWESNRKIASKTLNEFGNGKSSLEHLIQNEITKLVQELSLRESEATSIEWDLNSAILNVMWLIAAGKRYENNDKEIIDIWSKLRRKRQILEGNLKILDIFPWTASLIPNAIKNKYLHVDELKKNISFLRHFLENIIEDHKRTFDKDKIRDFIDKYLLDLEEGGADQEGESFKKENLNLTLSVMDFITAGVESTASTLQWFFLYMLKYPNVQKMLQKEIDSVIGKVQNPSLEDRQRLPLLEATLCEVNRIVSFMPYGSPHIAVEDAELDGYKIPKGTYILPCTELCHNNPKYFENPNEFQPARFLDTEGRLMNKEGYLPYSIGSRVCLGESLAKMELFLFSSAILQKFELTTPEEDTIDLTPDSETPFANMPKPFRIIFRERGVQISNPESLLNSMTTKVEPETIYRVSSFKPQALPQVFNLEPQEVVRVTKCNPQDTNFDPLTMKFNPDGLKVEKTIIKVQSHDITNSHEFEPQIFSKGLGNETTTKSQSTEIKSELNSEVTGDGSQVRSRVTVRKSQVQSKVTVVKSQTTSSNWSDISSTIDDKFDNSPSIQQGDLSELIKNLGGNFNQIQCQENQIPILETMELNSNEFLNKIDGNVNQFQSFENPSPIFKSMAATKNSSSN